MEVEGAAVHPFPAISVVKTFNNFFAPPAPPLVRESLPVRLHNEAENNRQEVQRRRRSHYRRGVKKKKKKEAIFFFLLSDNGP